MSDFSFKAPLQQYYSYNSKLNGNFSSEQFYEKINESLYDLDNPMCSILFSASQENKTRFLNGFYANDNGGRWMSKVGVVNLDIPSDGDIFFIKGYIPDNFFENDKLTLTVLIDEEEFAFLEVANYGVFIVHVKLDKKLLTKPRRSALVKVVSSHSINPSQKFPNNNDVRDLSFVLNSIGFCNEKELENLYGISQTEKDAVSQPLFPYFKGNCTVCGTEQYFILDNYFMYRESLICSNCNSSNRIRQLSRGLLKYLNTRGIYSNSVVELKEKLSKSNLKIYDTDSNYYVSKLLREHSGYITSDYRPDVSLGEEISQNHFCQDLSYLTFTEKSFDVILSSDVFEHVRLYERAIKEIYRVLRPGGVYIFTVPFDSELEEHKIYVKVNDENDSSKDEDLLPRVYHGDTISNGGALLYRIYGKQLFKELESAGFVVKYERLSVPNSGIYDCDLFYAYKPTDKEYLTEESEYSISVNTYTKVINIELSSICNLRCVWCILDHTKPKQYLNLSVLENILNQIKNNELPYLERIELHNGGETLLHPQIDQAFELIAKYRKEFVKQIFISLLTNGTVLKESTLQILTSQDVVDEIRISLDGGTVEEFEKIRKGAKWPKVSVNVKRFREAMNNYSSKTKLGIICMINKDKSDTQDWMEQEFKDVLTLADNVEIRYPHSWEGTLPEELNLKADPFKKNPNKLCKFLKHDLVVLANSDVSICCADLNGRGVVGNAANDSLIQIAEGENRQNIIRLWKEGKFDQIEICSTCEGYYDNEEELFNEGKPQALDEDKFEPFFDEIQNQINNGDLFAVELKLNSFLEKSWFANKLREYNTAVLEKRNELRTNLNWTGKKSAQLVIQAEGLIQKEKIDEAIKKLITVVNIEPTHIEALNDLSVAYILANNILQAVEIIEYILQNDNSNEVALENLNYLKENNLLPINSK